MELRILSLRRGLERLLIIFRDVTVKWSSRSDVCAVDVDEKYFSQKGFSMENFQSLLRRRANRLQSLLDRFPEVLNIDSSLSELPPPLRRTVLVDRQTAQSSPSESDLSVESYAVVAAAAVLLSLVYHYLTGHADRGGSIPYSSGSLDFRDTYIPIILFHGGYVWIKSRDDVAFKGVLPKKSRDKDGNIRVRFEPRFKPSHPKDEPSRYIYVGRYDTPEEASILYQITAFCYNGRGGLLRLEDGNSLTIPPMIDSDRRLTGAAKRKCVATQVRRVYNAFKAESRANAAAQHGVDHTNSVSLNSDADTTCGAPLPVNLTHCNSEMGITPCGNHGLESLCEFCIVGLEFPLGNGVEAQASCRDANDSREGVVATQIPMGCGSEYQLDLIEILLRNQHELISRVQELSKALQQRDIEHQQLKVQLTELQNHQCPHHPELQEFSSHSLPLQDEQPFQVPALQAFDDPISNDLFGFFAYPSIARY